MNVIIFDTETVGKVSQDLLNVGYKIVDINIQHADGKVLVARDYLVRDLYNNRIYMLNDDFVGAKKLAKYDKLVADGMITLRNIKQVFTTMANDIKKYNVLFGYAYNCDFDTDKFKRTADGLGITNPLEGLPIFDIWAYAYEFVINTEDYKKWATQTEEFTATGFYISGTVESVIRYLFNNKEFEEDHTALSDVQWETEILLECIRRNADITRALPKAKRLASEKVFHQVIVLPDGKVVEFDYKKQFVRGDRITYKG